ncbi:MAG TPA: hypothetical protein VF928_08140 [Usitatibacteraceae bacterium]
MSNNYLVVSGAVFGVVAVIQAVRAFNQWPVHIATLDIPVWFSWIAMVAAGSMCAWAFRCRGK